MSNETKFTGRKKFQTGEPLSSAAELTVLLKKEMSVKSIMDKEMSGSAFLKLIFLCSIIGLLLIIGINVSIDLYGLFRPVKGRHIPVYNNERVSKYLLAHRYVPANFNTVIVGTSLSANLDVTDYNKPQSPLQIYNSSVMGANISEIKPIVEKLVEGGIKNMIICFSPYMTKNSGSKEVEFGPKLYYGAFGSKNLYETYAIALIRHYELMPKKLPKKPINEYGVNYYNDMFKVRDIQAQIDLVIRGKKNEKLNIDPVAYQELKSLIQLLKDKQINFIGYFHPVPLAFYKAKQADYDRFEKAVRDLVQDDEKLIDFNTEDFTAFTTDYSNYIDHGHLSIQGQKTITGILIKKLESSASTSVCAN